MGGIKRVLAANKDDVVEISFVDGNTAGEGFKAFYLTRNTGSMTSSYQINAENGTRYVQTELVMVFNKMETRKRVEMTALAQNDLVLIVEDANGRYWLLGKDEPVKATTGDAQTGTARADRNGYSITLQDNSYEMPYEVDPDIIEGLLE